MSLAILILVVVAGLAFDFINGFHDTANSIATVVSTGVMRPRTAVLMSAAFNIFGACMGTAVASTISKDILDPAVVTQPLVLCALLSAIFWNLFTWYFGIPSSSSHALVGGLVGAGLAVAGPHAVQAIGLEKVVVALVVSPFLGFGAAFVLMIAETWLFRHARPSVLNSRFRTLQLLSSALLSYSHGNNDAQKTMGVIALALMTYAGDHTVHEKVPLPWWVILACAVAMGLGTSAGGWRIIHTMGTKIFKLRPIHGFTSNASAALVILSASKVGLPTSTTHCMTAAIMGAGATTRLSAVKWGVTRRILGAWLLTIPISAGVGAILYRGWVAVLGP